MGDLQVIYFVLLSLFICCDAQTGKKWPEEVFVPPYYLLSVRAERYILPVLPYALGDLEPYIDRDTMVAHYDGHHDAYRRNMNAALNEWREDVRFTGIVFFLYSYLPNIYCAGRNCWTSFKFWTKVQNADNFNGQSISTVLSKLDWIFGHRPLFRQPVSRQPLFRQPLFG